ncbi:ImmA/IrrE family metallo-endopeptidase [Acidovorax sp. LjRoot194]|uniref:ImmA/IrrE family metallo-endopeptidase n=1 Tax=Acidovorax sp. LjRoot194 TaxID=3342280 RepID=UPI003ED05FC7
MTDLTTNFGSSTPLQVIKDDSQYARYLGEIRELMRNSPHINALAPQRIELLAVLLEKYEEERFLLSSVDPVDAITMRMVELGFEQKDLARILGSASRASEVLNRRRQLSLEQMRLLHSELNIPAEVLLGRPASAGIELDGEIINQLPLTEMARRGWLGRQVQGDGQLIERFREFLAKVSLGATPVFMRRSIFGGVAEKSKVLTYAWLARVIMRARENRKINIRFNASTFNVDFLLQVAKLSAADNGPKLAQEFLAMKGIILIAEPQLSGMEVDGAVLRDDDGTPIIGLTLRFDRLDNFWFTLLHELAHLLRHFSNQSVAFIDDLANLDDSDPRESEADAIAGECLIPRSSWNRSLASRTRKKEDIDALASSLCIHPAIIAGRIRKETNNWRLLSKMVGQDQARKHFPDATWE